ncbi:energy transducer TonB [Paraburkholderia sediminicola]|uniref:Energy transducer TonB n=1 Tax=Paraburkholderia rhynchosiae TaxID=487049 RepID=A0ACC7NJP5_9BURK
MSNVGRLSNRSLLDEPKPRIVVAVAIAFGLWCAALVLIGGLLVTPEITPPSPPNLDAQLVEIEPPPPATSTPARAAPANVAPQIPPVHHATSQHAAAPALAAARPAAARVVPPPAPSPVAAPSAMPSPAPAAPASDMPLGSAVNRSSATTDLAPSGSGHIGARPITQPLPEIPDDLREAAYHAIALARFTIHPDGSVDVELLQPTQQPRLNQLLLASLHNWRFFPATENGKPVESHQDVRVHLVVQ